MFLLDTISVSFRVVTEEKLKTLVKPRAMTPITGIWMNLQLDYEFMRADREKGDAIRKEVQPCAA